MPSEITDKNRGLVGRSVPVMGAEVFRFRKSDGTSYELEFKGGTSPARWTAQTWADYFGHKLLSENPRSIQERSLTPPPLVQAQTPEPDFPLPFPLPFSPPPLVQANVKRPKPKSEPTKPKPSPETQPPAPKPPAPHKREPVKIEEYSIWDYIKDPDGFTHTTMTESLPLIATWFGRVGKVIGYVPGLGRVGKGYEVVAEIAEGLNLLYELVHELKKADAFEKGSKKLVNKVKPVKKISETLLKKKYPGMPEVARKKIAGLLESWFEEYGADPAIKKLRKKAEEQDEGKDLQDTLFKELKKALTLDPTSQ